MFIIIFALANIFFASASINSKNSPAKVIFWKPRSLFEVNDNNEPVYRSQSMYNQDVVKHLEESAKDVEIVVYFQSAGDNSIFLNDILKQSVLAAQSALVLPTIYASSATEVPMSEMLVSNHIIRSNAMKNAQELTLGAFHKFLSENKNSVLNNKRPDSFVISLESDSDADTMKKVHQFSSLSVPMLFVATEDSKSAIAPQQQGNYHRVLQTTAQKVSTVQGDIYYKPEGGEYAMYYANTYLYLTPDIFTGLMTGVFVFFVLLIGLNCLGSIQGPSSFVSKGPSVGREV